MMGRWKIAIIFLIVFAVLGISASFMPWLYFPKTDMSFYGYKADGVVTAFIFFLILIFGIYSLVRKKLPSISSWVFAALSLWMVYLSYNKYSKMEAEKINFESSNAMFAAASAGAELGIGIYFFGFAGLGALLSILAGIYFQQANQNSTSKTKLGLFLKIIIPISLLLIASYFIKQQSDLSSYSVASLKPVLSEEVTKMGKALSSGDYETFANYNHPTMLQSIGGKEKMIELTKSTMEEMKVKGISIQEVALSEVLDFAIKGTNIQVLINQQVTLNVDGSNKNENQTMIAVSDDAGEMWKFINISGKSKEEITAFFPRLNQNLNF